MTIMMQNSIRHTRQTIDGKDQFIWVIFSYIGSRFLSAGAGYQEATTVRSRYHKTGRIFPLFISFVWLCISIVWEKMSGTLMRRALSKAVRNGVFLTKRDLSRSADGIITSGLADVHIPDVPIEEFVFEKAHKWENHIVAVSLFIVLFLTSVN